jgi:hypothetical protein
LDFFEQKYNIYFDKEINFFDRVFLNKKTKQNKIKNFLKIMVYDDIEFFLFS